VEVLANDVTFLDSRGSESADSSDEMSGSAPAGKPTPSKKAKSEDEVVIEDIGDAPINLDDIPF